MNQGSGSRSTADPAPDDWRTALPLVAVSGGIVAGLLAGWYSAILALSLPFYPWSGVTLVAALGLAAWRSRRRPWLCALLVGGCLAAAGGWVLLVLAGQALANF